MRKHEAGPPAEADCAVLGEGVSGFSYPEGGQAAVTLTTPRCGGRTLDSPATPSSGDAARQDGPGAQPITRAPCDGESLPVAPKTLSWTASLRIPSQPLDLPSLGFSLRVCKMGWTVMVLTSPDCHDTEVRQHVEHAQHNTHMWQELGER